jgi:hypothetical protein
VWGIFYQKQAARFFPFCFAYELGKAKTLSDMQSQTIDRPMVAANASTQSGPLVIHVRTPIQVFMGAGSRSSRALW